LKTPTPGTRIAEVDNETHALLKDKCSMRAKKEKHLKVRNTYSLPRVERKQRHLSWMGSYK